MLVEDVTGAAPTCDGVADIQTAHASRNDRIRYEFAQRRRPNQRPEIRLVAHVHDLERNSASPQRLSERASGVEGDQPCVMPHAAKAGQQDRQLSLGASGAQARTDEQGFRHAAQSSRYRSMLHCATESQLRGAATSERTRWRTAAPSST